jgi:protein-disulfide isomerase
MSKTKHIQQASNRNTAWILVGIAALVVGVLAIVATTFRTDGADPQAQQAEADARQVALASEHAPSQGNPDAKVHIVEFLDPSCETCAVFYPMV